MHISKSDAAAPVKPHESDEVRQKIIAASKHLMSIYGSAKLSMVDVARVAKVSRATVYNYFQSKDSLIHAAEVSLREVFFDALHAEVMPLQSFEDRIAAIAVFIRQTWTDRQHTPWFGFLSPMHEAILVAAGARQHFRDLIGFISPLVAEAQKSGEIRADLEQKRAADWISRLVLSFALEPAEDDMNDPVQIRKSFSEFLICGFQPGSASSAHTRSVAKAGGSARSKAHR